MQVDMIDPASKENDKPNPKKFKRKAQSRAPLMEIQENIGVPPKETKKKAPMSVEIGVEEGVGGGIRMRVKRGKWKFGDGIIRGETNPMWSPNPQ